MEKNKNLRNPVVYFEIPVNDIQRAVSFYSNVFEITFEMDEIDGNQMALFPFQEGVTGITGALAKGDIYKPTLSGTLIYFKCCDIDKTLSLATASGADILYPKTISNDGTYAVAEIKDCEGNRIALHQSILKTES